MSWRGALVALSAAVALSLAGCGTSPDPYGASVPAATTTPESAPAAPAPVVHLNPQSVAISKLSVWSSLVPTHLNKDGTAEVPPVTQPLQASYLDWDDKIEAQRPLVLYGHINGRDGAGRSVPGVFAKLATLKPGDEVMVGYPDGANLIFKIREVDQVPKTGFPTDKVYGTVDHPEIRLVTCTGAFDSSKRSYVDNFIAYGVLEAG